jgi:hypothetical protein
MDSHIEQAAKQKLYFTLGNVLGVLSIVDLFPLYFLTIRKTADRLDYVFPWLLLLSIILPILAAWKSSKLWLLMLICPITLYIYGITRF